MGGLLVASICRHSSTTGLQAETKLDEQRHSSGGNAPASTCLRTLSMSMPRRGVTLVATKNISLPKEKTSALGFGIRRLFRKISGAIQFTVPLVGRACLVSNREMPKSRSLGMTV